MIISDRELAKAKEQMRKLGIFVPAQNVNKAWRPAVHIARSHSLRKGSYCYAIETMSRAGLTDPVTGRTLCRFDSIKSMEEWVKGNPNRKRTERKLFRGEIERAERLDKWTPLGEPFKGEYLS